MKAKRILKSVALNSTWKKVTLKKYNDFYLTAIKKDKNGKKDTLDKDCVKKIKFEIAIGSGKRNKHMLHTQVVVDFNQVASRDAEFDKIIATAKVAGCPSIFYIRAIEMVGEFSTVTEGRTAIEVYVNELRLG